MFFRGIEFGVGFCIGTMIAAIAVIAIICLIEKVSYLFGRRKLERQADEALRRSALWTKSPELTASPKDPFRTFSFRTVVRWDGRRCEEEPQSRD